MLAFLIGFLLVACSPTSDEKGVGENRTPLAEFLGTTEDPILGSVSQVDRATLQVAEQRAREELIAACMAEQGFDYIAWVPESTSGSAFNSDIEPYSQQWAEEFGFGITTSAFGQSRVGPDLVGFDDRSIVEAGADNPNHEIVASLSESAAEAYFEALFGPRDGPVSSDGSVTDDRLAPPGGCVGTALRDPTANVATRLRTELQSEIVELQLRVAADARILEFEANLARCVQEQGYEFVSYRQILSGQSPWQDELEELRVALTPAELANGETDEIDDLTSEELDDLAAEETAEFSLGAKLSDTQRQTLGRLQDEERELAVAVFGCGGLGAEEADLRADVMTELQDEFIENNRQHLTDIRGTE